MAEYEGYEIVQSTENGKWEILWKGKKVEGGFIRQADAEEWIDDQIPSNRTS